MCKRQIILVLLFISTTSSLWSQEITNQHLKLWFRADSVEVENGSVVQWYDLSGNNNNALQPEATKRPLVVDDIVEINHKRAVRFDGVNDFMEFPFQDSIRTVFMVLKHATGNSSSFPPILGDSQHYDFIGNTGTKLFNYPHLSANIKNGTLKLNQNIKNALTVEKPTEYSLLEISATGNLRARYITNDRNTFGYWQGDFAEIIIFDTILSSSESEQIYQYLRDRYSPPVNLGDDINIPYGFCDTTITTADKPYFRSYLWNTGDTTATISVNEPRYYSVTTTDVFGFTSTDSVKVSFETPQVDNSQICLGDSVLYTSGLDNYQHLWHNGSVNDSIWIKQQGDYFLKLTDSLGCYSTFNFEVQVDSFSARISFSEDTLSLCSGNTIGLSTGQEECTSFLWMPSSETSENIQVTSSGWNILNVENQIGCKAIDSVYVDIIGTAPVINYEVENLCLGEATIFRDMSTSSDNITERIWVFNDTDTLLGETVNKIFQNSGTQNIHLKVVSESGCYNTQNFQIEISETADVSFENDSICANVEVDFIPNISMPQGTSIVSYSWMLDNSLIGTEELLSYTFSDTGLFNLEFVITLDNGCSPSFAKNISVKQDYLLQNQLSLVSPSNNTAQEQSQPVHFSWNSNPLTVKYVLQISNHINFENILLEQETDINETNLNLNFPYDTLYWRVKAYNPCLIEQTSEVRSLLILSPNNFPNKLLWFRADSVELENGSVKQWYDLSGNNNNALQPEVTKQPLVVDDIAALNHKKALRFDGADDFMAFPFQDSIRTVFMVLKHATGSSSSYPPILGDSLYYDFIGNAGAELFNYTHLSENIKNGVVKLNQNLTDVLTVEKPTQYSLLEIGASDNLRARYITNDRNSFGYWQGDFAEIIIFDTILPVDQTQQLYQYFRGRYSPPVNLGYDIKIPYGFCDTTITTADKPYFKSYLWNTGDTTATISVNRSGYYSVTTTDVFGFTSTDSLFVKFPGEFLSSDSAICYGSSILWDTRLDEGYSFLWQDNASLPYYQINSEGSYSLTITDTLGCQFKTDTIHVSVNMYPETMSLGDDGVFCSGGNLYIQDGWEETQTYQWSNGESDDHIEITNAGTYSVTATNDLGCIAIDTINITVEGHAPEPDFTTNNNCLPGQVEFIDNSTLIGQASISEWHWDFNNGTTSQEQNPITQFSDTGDYNVTLKIVTDDACENTLQKTVRIYRAPVADFRIGSALCEDNFINFINESTSSMGDIQSVKWEFDDNTVSNDVSVQKLFSDDGTQHIRLMVESLYGCKDTLDSLIQIKPSPIADFSQTETCMGSEILFNNETDLNGVFGIASWHWATSQGDESNDENPKFMFISSGEKQISMTAFAINGCMDSIQRTITVAEPPVADFILDTVCQNRTISIQNNSYDNQSSIENYYWWLDGELISSENQPNIVLEDTLEHRLLLKVMSQSLCSDTLSRLFVTNPAPISAFSVSGNYITPNIPISFEAESINDSYAYNLDFGDGSTSDAYTTTHAYTQEGDYSISMQVTTQWGCQSVTNKEITVVQPLLDLAINSMDIVENNGKYQFQILVSNIGNLDINSINVKFQVDDRYVFEEVSQTQLMRGESQFLMLGTQLLEEPDYACVNIYPTELYQDIDMNNNLLCVNQKKSKEVFSIYPNPVKSEYTFLHYSSKDKTVNVRIINVLGLEVETFELDLKKGLNKYIFDSEKLRQGQYIFNMEGKTIKFFKE